MNKIRKALSEKTQMCVFKWAGAENGVCLLAVTARATPVPILRHSHRLDHASVCSSRRFTQIAATTPRTGSQVRCLARW